MRWIFLLAGLISSAAPALAQTDMHAGMDRFTSPAKNASSATPSYTVTGLGNNNSGGPTSTITSSAAVLSGQLVVVAISDTNWPASGQTLGDSKSNIYTLDNLTQDAGGNNAQTQIWHSFLTTPLTTSDTINYNNGGGGTETNSIYLNAVKVTTAVSIDSATTAGATNNSAAYSVTGAGSAAETNEIYFGYVYSDNTITPSGGWTAAGTSPCSWCFFGYQVNSGTSPLTFNGTLGATWWTASIVSFKH
jgi:hypothetical protein